MIRAFALAATATAGLFLSMPVLAQTYPAAPAILAPRPFHLPVIESYVLPNGMTVTLVPFGLAPKASIRLSVDAGAINAGHDAELASLAGDMLTQGTDGRTSTRIAQDAAAMGGDLTVSAGDHQTTLSLAVLSDRTAAAIALIGDVALHPAFPPGEFDKVKADALRTLAVTLSQAGSIADYALARAYFGPDHPYGNIPTAAQLSAYTLADVRHFHDANFGAKRAHLYIAGRFDAASVKTAIARVFGGWASGPAKLELPPQPKPGPQIVLVDRPGAPQSTIRLAYPVPVETDAHALQLQVMDALLGGSFGSRIVKNIREDKGYTYSPDSTVDYRPHDASWTFSADVTTAVTGASFHELFGEIRRLQGQAPDDPEANGMRTYLGGLFALRNSYSDGIVSSLAKRDLLGLPSDWLERYVPGVLSVTPAQIQDEAKVSLPIARSTIVVVGDLATVRPQLEAQPELKGIAVQTVTIP